MVPTWVSTIWILIAVAAAVVADAVAAGLQQTCTAIFAVGAAAENVAVALAIRFLRVPWAWSIWSLWSEHCDNKHDQCRSYTLSIDIETKVSEIEESFVLVV
jgi:hypothetical protein